MISEFKKKSLVEFNGEHVIIGNWVRKYKPEINKEFEDRYDKIKNDYEQLVDDVYWNSLLYNTDICKIKIKPVINNIYHLYKKDNGSYFLSIISPDEWNSSEYVQSFKFTYNGKWVKIKKYKNNGINKKK